MAGFDIGKGLQGLFKGASDAVQGAVGSVRNIKLPQVKPEEFLGIFTKRPAEPVSAPQEQELVACLSPESALKIIYYMMAADGEPLEDEVEKFAEIGPELDVDFAAHSERLEAKCKAWLARAVDAEDYFDALQEGIAEAVREPEPKGSASISAKLLIWDLLVMAYSDAHFSEREQRLLRSVVRRLAIDREVILEMEGSLQAISALEGEMDWIKRTDRPYLEIEEMVKEVEERKNVIFASVKDLIEL